MKKKLMMIMLSALTLQAYASTEETKMKIKEAHDKSKAMEMHLKGKVEDAKEKNNEAKAKKNQSKTNAKDMNKMLAALKKAHKMQADVTKHLASATK